MALRGPLPHPWELCQNDKETRVSFKSRLSSHTDPIFGRALPWLLVSCCCGLEMCNNDLNKRPSVSIFHWALQRMLRERGEE